jgi:hypothetical protein
LIFLGVKNMYIATECVYCGGKNVHDIGINYQKIIEIVGKQEYTTIHFKSVTVDGTFSEEVLIDHILKTLQEIHKLNVSKEELIEILKSAFGISKGSVDEIAKEVIRQKTAKNEQKPNVEKI